MGSVNVYKIKVVWESPDKFPKNKASFLIEKGGIPPYEIALCSLEELARNIYGKRVSEIYSSPPEHVNIEYKKGKPKVPVNFVRKVPLKSKELKKLREELEHLRICSFVDKL